ncbi:MAG: N-acetylmuramoyl-L-alanine amidase [Candidatus Cohnella colombiensis]|uniref:N-acetylmuramoyl-L-alanine amidase n=1 Tax=Candidatus Cohnella colombiensis TaxID=3121368 RepID=A0AA95EXT4_9BACL|nr:MAG: N-acetylmuramoyl-L-alanine amidase [Cohnella sp.]
MKRILLWSSVLCMLVSGATTICAEGIDAGPPHIRRALPTADVIIDAGHGGIDGGTHWNDIMEKDINLAIARKLYMLLRSKGIIAVLNRTGDYALSDENRWHLSRSRHRRDLSQRKGLAQEINASLFISIHVNWSPRGHNQGPLVIHQAEGSSALLAALIQSSLNQQQNKHRLPQVAKQFYLLNQVELPSVIIETAFLSDPDDRAMLTSLRGQTRIAEAIAQGIMAYRWISP